MRFRISASLSNVKIPTCRKAENVERERNGIEGAAWHFHLLSPQELPNRYRIAKRN
jgi:hypothetical protein